jgi:hypothetical protein
VKYPAQEKAEPVGGHPVFLWIHMNQILINDKIQT